MITTFKAMTLFGSGDASVVSAGIAEALITTEVGLVVAIPAVLAHALMSRKVKSYFAQLENDAVNLSQIPVRAGSA
jgi:biopolymer transport protein ExbB